MNFLYNLVLSIKKNNSLLCVGLDTDFEKLPQSIRKVHEPIFAFNKSIIDATADLVCCYKIQIAYYASLGIPGIQALMQTVHYIHTNYPDLPVILDAKRADIGETSEKYVQEVFDSFEADAATVNPYLGKDSLLPFLQRREKGVIVLCRTSNKGAKDFQDLPINGEPLYMHVAKEIVSWHKEFGNCLMVVGATWPEELRKIRELAPEMFFLVPGVGAQGGDLEQTLKAGLRNDKSGLIIHSARSILYASDGDDFAQKAREETIKLRDQINSYRK